MNILCLMASKVINGGGSNFPEQRSIQAGQLIDLGNWVGCHGVLCRAASPLTLKTRKART